jgi:hypothetical protein
LSNSQINAVDHTLCNQCVHFLSKDIKSKDFAHSFPSFLWNLLVGKRTPVLGASYYYNAVYSGQETFVNALKNEKEFLPNRVVLEAVQRKTLHSMNGASFNLCK